LTCHVIYSDHIITIQHDVTVSCPHPWRPNHLRNLPFLCQTIGCNGSVNLKKSEKHLDFLQNQRNINYTLIYSMVYKADDILTSFGLSDCECRKYSVVNKKFNRHFVRNEVSSWNVQNLTLNATEKDSFITDLQCTIKHTMHEEIFTMKWYVSD